MGSVDYFGRADHDPASPIWGSLLTVWASAALIAGRAEVINIGAKTIAHACYTSTIWLTRGSEQSPNSESDSSP